MDFGGLELACDARTTRLTPKAATVLHLLAARAGETVSRNEILDAAWPAGPASDEALTQVIAELRRAFADDAREARWIATIPRLGYRWVGPAPVAPSPPVATPTAPAEGAAAPLPRRPAALVTGIIVVSLVVATIAFAWRRDARPVLAHVRPVTAEPGLERDPALSADGKRIAYVQGSGDAAELRVRTLDDGHFTLVPLTGSGRPAGPAWSPDGMALAFLWIDGKRCELRRVTLADGRVDTIADGCPASLPGDIDWSPDGHAILFARFAGDDATLAKRGIAIHRVAPDGTGLARVSDAHRWLVADGHPRFSRDGKRFAFVRDGEGRRVIVVASVEGDDEREVSFARWPYRVAWAGEDALLVAAHGRQPAELWHVDLAAGDRPTSLSDSAGPGLSAARDGSVFAWEQRTVDDNIWRLALDDGDAQPVAVTRGSRSELVPRLSPDGGTLAFLGDDDGAFEVTLLDLAAGTTRRITRFAPRAPVDLRWAPSGRWLAVVLGTAEGRRAAIVARDGTPIAIPAPLSQWRVAQVEWTPDEASLLATVESDGRRTLHRLPFPALDRDELVTDPSVGAFAAERDSVYVRRARSNSLERVARDASLVRAGDIELQASPADQWLLRDGVLAELVQSGDGAQARLSFGVPGAPAGPRVLSLAAPEPPIGRGFDLGAGAVWFARRDLDRVDLMAASLVPR